MKKILIVDDDPEFRENLSEILNQSGYETESAGSASDAFEKLKIVEYDLVLLDFMMPKLSGLDAIFEIKRLRPTIKLIMITAFASIEHAVTAVKKGVSDYISKPFKIDHLLLTIRRVFEEARFEEGIKHLDMDRTLSTLASPIRRSILMELQKGEKLHLMELARELGIDDHTKVVFHLKILKEAGIIDQATGRAYFLSDAGRKMIECLKTLERYLSGQ